MYQKVSLVLTTVVLLSSARSLPRKGAWLPMTYNFVNLDLVDSESRLSEHEPKFIAMDTDEKVDIEPPNNNNYNNFVKDYSTEVETIYKDSGMASNAVVEDITINEHNQSKETNVQLVKDLLRSVSAQETAEDDPVKDICQTPECLQVIQDYLLWRKQNGYPSAGGRWG